MTEDARDNLPDGGETHQTAGGHRKTMTTQQGVPVSDDQNSLRAGRRGPTLMEDFHFREKIFHFDHERIPERVVHARGFGAHGFFETYERLSDLTVADLFQTAGQRTPAFVRFSTGPSTTSSPRQSRWCFIPAMSCRGSTSWTTHFCRVGISRISTRNSAAPTPDYDYRPGRWVGEDDWPSPRVTPERYLIAEGRNRRPEDAAPSHKQEQVDLNVQSPVTLGLHAGKWCSYANGPDLAGDQRNDDDGALVFQTARLEKDMELLGAPEVELELDSDQPVAMVAVRLSDMRPDRQVTRVTYGMLNLTHRDSRDHPEAPEPGRFYRVRVPMCYIAQRIPNGHRVRLSVSTVCWPLAWTPPEAVRLTIRTEKSKLTLPCREKVKGERIPEFGEPVQAPGPAVTSLAPPDHEWMIRQDLGRRWTELRVTDDRGVMRLDDIGLTAGACAVERYGARPGDFTSPTGETERVRTLERDGWRIKTRTRTRLTSERDNFHLTAELDAWEDGARVRCLSWNETIPRDML